MSAGVLVVGLFAIAAASCGMVATFYYGLWRGGVLQIREQWRAAPSDVRRRMITIASFELLLAAVLLAVAIIAPFGPRSFIYVFAGICGLLVLAIPIIASIEAWKSLHRKK